MLNSRSGGAGGGACWGLGGGVWEDVFSFLSSSLCFKDKAALSSSIVSLAIAFCASTCFLASPSSMALAKIAWALSNSDLTLAEYSVKYPSSTFLILVPNSSLSFLTDWAYRRASSLWRSASLTLKVNLSILFLTDWEYSSASSLLSDVVSCTSVSSCTSSATTSSFSYFGIVTGKQKNILNLKKKNW